MKSIKTEYPDYTVWRNEIGQFHREDGPAIEWRNGDKEWWLNDHRHREDGPAIEKTNGYKAWYHHDQFHRENGPAVKYPNGHKEWWLNDKLINCSSQEEFEQLMKLKAFW